MENATKYEVINKETTEVMPVIAMAFGEGYVDATIEGEVIRFDNTNADGNLTNEFFAIREVDTHSQPDGTGSVDNEGNNVD